MGENKIKKQYCDICSKKFSLTRSSKLCKRCNHDVCSDCLNQKKKIIYGLQKDGLKPHKRCIYCSDDQDAIDKLIKNNYLIWGRDTQIADDWLVELNINPNSNLDQYYQENLNNRNYLNSPSYNTMIENVNQYSSIREHFKQNYSFYEALSIIQNNLAEGEIKQQIKNVLSAFLSKHYKDIGFSKSIFTISIFLMMFCTPCKVFVILSELHKKIIPSFLFENNKIIGGGIKQTQINNFTNIMRNKMNIDHLNLPKIQNFIEQQWISSIPDLFLDELKFDVAFQSIDSIIRANNKYCQLIKIFLSIPQINIQNILRISGNNKLLMQEIIYQTKYKDIKEKSNFDLNIEQPIFQTNNIQILMDSIQQLQQENIELSERNKKLNGQNEKNQTAILLLAAEVERVQKSDMKLQTQNQNKDIKKIQKSSSSSSSDSDHQQGYTQQEYKKQIKQLENKYKQLQQDYYLQKQNYEINYDQLNEQIANLKQQLEQNSNIEEINYQKQLLQKNFDDIEAQYMDSCSKFLIVAAECQRLSERNKDLQEVIDSQSISSNTDSLEAQGQQGILKVRINKLQKDLVACQMTLRETEEQNEKELEDLKKEYKDTTEKELKSIYDKFQAEVQYLQAEIEKQNSQTQEWEEKAVVSMSENERLRRLLDTNKERIEKLENQLQQKNQSEKKFQRIHTNQTIQSSNEYDQQLAQARKYNTNLKDNLNKYIEKFKKILEKYFLQVIENKRLNKILEEIRGEIKDWKENCQKFQDENDNLIHTIQKRDSIIQSLQEEIDSFRYSSKSFSSISGEHEKDKQIQNLQQEKAQLIKDNGNLQLVFEQLNLELSTSKQDLEKLRQKEKNTKQKLQKDLEELKKEYEEVVIKEVTETAQRKINSLKQQLQQKDKQYEEILYNLQEQLKNQQCKIDEIEENKYLLNQQLQQLEKNMKIIQKENDNLNDTLTLQSSELQRKNKRIDDLEAQLSLLNEQLDMNKADLQRREKKIDELEKNFEELELQSKDNIRSKNNQIDELQEQVSLLSSELARIRIERDDLKRDLQEQSELFNAFKEDLEKQKDKYNKMVNEKNEKIYLQETEHAQQILKLQKEKNDKIKEIQEKNSQTSQSQKEKDNDINQKNIQIEEIENQLIIIQKEVQRKEKDNQQMKNRLQEYEDKIKEKEKLALDSKRELKHTKTELQEIQETIHVQEEKNKNYSGQFQKAMGRIFLLATENERLLIINQNLHQTNNEIIKQEKKLQNIKDKQILEIEELQKLIQKQQTQLQQIDIEKKNQTEDQIIEKQRKIEELKNQLVQKETIIENHTIEIREVKTQIENQLKQKHGRDQDLDELLKRLRTQQQKEEDNQNQIEELKQEISLLQDKIAAIVSENERLNKKIQNYEQEVADSRTEVEIKKNQLKESQNIIDAMKTTLRHKNKSLVESEEQCQTMERNTLKALGRYILVCSENERLLKVIGQNQN